MLNIKSLIGAALLACAAAVSFAQAPAAPTDSGANAAEVASAPADGASKPKHHHAKKHAAKRAAKKAAHAAKKAEAAAAAASAAK